MQLVTDGVVDREGVKGLAARLGYSVRQIERQLGQELGAGPLALARAQRARSARQVIESTDLPFAEVAFATGFSSVRQFNDTMREVYAETPTQLRHRARSGRRTEAPQPDSLHLRLPFRRPFTPAGLISHLTATAVPGVEEATATGLRRTLDLPHGHGIVELTPQETHIACTLQLADLRDLAPAVTRCRRLLDLDADPEAVASRLSEDPVLAPLVAKAPGRRVPRTVDGAEWAIRAVLGQQVSTAAARTHAGRLVQACGKPLDLVDPGGLTHVFPRPEAIAAVDPELLALPRSRRATVVDLASRLADGSIELDAGIDRLEALGHLAEVPGIGPWTLGMIAMRGLGDPDVLPVTDLGVKLAAEQLGLPSSARALTERSEPWQPWRSYAVQHLWAQLDHPINRPPTGHDGGQR
jgi:AraC family transcriptional regulator of adaptative response / DNA-3-methyladenine glycosylase II